MVNAKDRNPYSQRYTKNPFPKKHATLLVYGRRVTDEELDPLPTMDEYTPC